LGAGGAARAPDFSDEALTTAWPIALVLVNPPARTVMPANAIRNARE
jgi:hypothetical protein